MELLVNETPVKTSKNYHINHFPLRDFTIPSYGDFQGLDIRHQNPHCQMVSPQERAVEYPMHPELLAQSQQKPNVSVQIQLEEGEEAETPICLVFTFGAEDYQLVDNIHIVAKKHSKAQVILKYYGEFPENFQETCYKNTLLTAEIQEGAQLNITVLNLLPYECHNFFTHQVQSQKYSDFTLNLIDFGGKTSVNSLYSQLLEEKAQSKLHVIYIGKEEQRLDYNLITRLEGVESMGNIEVQGVLDDKARKSFKGTLDFVAGAENSVGYENEFCSMLSEDCRSLAMPMLLCQEENVEGTHSSGSGKLDEEVLFYIESRGIPHKEARKLIVKANFYEIIQNVPCEVTKAEIMDEIERRIS